MFWVPCLCFSCVSVVCWCLGGIEGIAFPKASPMLGFSFRDVLGYFAARVARQKSRTSKEGTKEGRKERGKEGRQEGRKEGKEERHERGRSGKRGNSLEIAWGELRWEGAMQKCKAGGTVFS